MLLSPSGTRTAAGVALSTMLIACSAPMTLRMQITAAATALCGCVVAPAGAPRHQEPGQNHEPGETYTFPAALKPFAEPLEDAGIHIVYGPNPAPVPESLSDEAKEMWANLPRLPLPVKDPELAAMRAVTFALEDVAHERMKEAYSLRDETINGTTVMRVTPPQLKHDDKIMIFIHGGGFILQSRKAQLPLQTAVASTLGVEIVSIEYPLAPEHSYPAATNHIVDAYKGLLDRYDAANMGLFGTSAGGGLVLATVLRLKHDGLPLPAASAALSPSADLTHSGDLFTLVGDKDPILPVQGGIDAFAAYVGTADPDDPLVSPVFGSYTGVTPLFLLSGTREIVGSSAIRVAARARQADCDVTLIVSDGMWHVPIGDGSGIPELQFAFDEMIKFLRKHLEV